MKPKKHHTRMTDFPKVGDCVELRDCAEVPAGVVLAVHATASAGWVCRVRPLYRACAPTEAPSPAQCHGAPVPRSTRKPYFGDAELVLAHAAVDIPATALGTAATVERADVFCARHTFPPGVWYCREAQDAHEPRESAPLRFANPEETVAAAALRTAVHTPAPSPRRVLRRLETADGDSPPTPTPSQTPTLSLGADDSAPDVAETAAAGAHDLRVVSTTELEDAAEGETNEPEPTTPLGTQPPEGTSAEAAAAELLFPEHSAGGGTRTEGAAILVEASVSDLGETPETRGTTTKEEAPPPPQQQQQQQPQQQNQQPQQPQQQGGMMSFLRSSAKNMRRGTLMGWLQESPTKKASPASQKPRLELYSPTKEGRRAGTLSRRQLPLRLFLSKEDKEALDRHSTHPFQRAGDSPGGKKGCAAAATATTTTTAGTKRGPQTLRDQFAMELKRCKQVECERKKQSRASRADTPDSDDERFVVSDGHESSDSEDDSKDEGDAPPTAAAAAQHAQPPTTTLWSFTLRQSFGVYLQMLVSACIDSEFLNSLHSDSASETSQYFLQSAFHVERQLLSRRDGIASSNVWEKSFHVCASQKHPFLCFTNYPNVHHRIHCFRDRFSIHINRKNKACVVKHVKETILRRLWWFCLGCLTTLRHSGTGRFPLSNTLLWNTQRTRRVQTKTTARCSSWGVTATSVLLCFTNWRTTKQTSLDSSMFVSPPCTHPLLPFIDKQHLEQKRIEFVEGRMPSTADAALIVNTLLDDNDWCSHVCSIQSFHSMFTTFMKSLAVDWTEIRRVPPTVDDGGRVWCGGEGASGSRLVTCVRGVEEREGGGVCMPNDTQKSEFAKREKRWRFFLFFVFFTGGAGASRFSRGAFGTTGAPSCRGGTPPRGRSGR